MMKKLELVFVPFPAIGHLVSLVEFARLLVGRDDRFSVTLLVMKGPFLHPALTNYLRSVSTCFSGSLRFVHLPHPQLIIPNIGQQPDSSNSNPSSSSSSSSYASSPIVFLHNIMEKQKLLVRDAVHQLMTRSDTGRLTGIVVDSFCTSMMDVADELGVPSYVFFGTSSAASLALMFHLQTLHDHHGVDLTEFADSDTELVVPGFVNSVPARVLPAMWVEKEKEKEKEGGGSVKFLNEARRVTGQAKGILVNTVVELESHVIDSFVDGATTAPPVYTVGPLLSLNHVDHQIQQRQEEEDDHGHSYSEVIRWLDDQPPSSVVFLCLGSVGELMKKQDQLENIASALESSGYRFLWSLRRPPAKGLNMIADDYINFIKEVLPEKFLDRTSEIGKIIGWAPQAAVLAHPAIGGFVSHCGWNSTLESIWYGVPVAAWPMYAEQQLNAFQLVKELGIGVEIKSLDHNNDVVSAHEIESRIRSLMDDSNIGIRKKTTCLKEMCRKALIEGGSSNSSILRFIGDIYDH